MTITAPLFQLSPEQGDPPPVDIIQIDPVGFPDGGVFTEVAETLVAGFRALGYAAEHRLNVCRIGVPTIVLGAHLIQPRDFDVFPAGAIVYNLEQVRPGAWAAHPDYLRILATHTVWDCDATSVQEIVAATGNTDVHHVAIGFVPELARIVPAPDQDIDVLFYGSLTPRREAILQGLAATGIRVQAAIGVYGAERDALIARARVVLNMHAHEGWAFEIVRVSYLLANGKAVVCEAATPEEIPADLRDAVLAVPYDELGEACLALLDQDAERDTLARRGHAAFRRRGEPDILHAALRLPRPDVVLPSGFADAKPHPAVDAYLTLLSRTLAHQLHLVASQGHSPEPDLRTPPSPIRGAEPAPASVLFSEVGIAEIRKMVEAILAARVPGDLIVAGSADYQAAIFLRGILKAHGRIDRLVWVPVPSGDPPQPSLGADTEASHRDCPNISIDAEAARADFAAFGLLDEQVGFVPTPSADALHATRIQQLALLLLDGIAHETTMNSLAALHPKVSPGGYVVVMGYDRAPACRRAVDEFRRERCVTMPIRPIDGLGVFWQLPP